MKTGSRLVYAVALALGTACSNPPAADDALYEPEKDLDETVRGEASLAIDSGSALLTSERREPQAGVVRVESAASSTFAVEVHAKTTAARPDLLWLDVYIVNRSAIALRGLAMSARAKPGQRVVDLTDNPLSDEPLSGPATVPTVVPFGVAHFALGVARNEGSLTLEIEARTTRMVGRSSAPLAVAGGELWVAQADQDPLRSWTPGRMSEPAS
jgi:hypothetical protein